MNRSLNAEAAVLGACLIDPQAYWRVADILDADDFSTAENRAAWTTIGDLSRSGVAPDFITVNQANPKLATAHLIDLANNTASSANVRGYAEWVISAATERRVRAAGQRIAKLGGADALAEAQRIMATCQPRAMSAVRPMREFVREGVALMQQRCDATDPITGVPTSLEWLDEMTSGWQRGDLIVIAARPSVGKTALALQSALHAAKCGHPVFFASLEQSGTQLAERSMANLSGVSLQRILQPKQIEEHEWPLVVNAGSDLSNLPILIDDTGALTVDAISARARQVNAERRLGLIAIDYLTQISPPRSEKTTDAIQIVTRSLKALAKELSIPLILLSQLNRDGDERPALKHLRDSGAIEQDADVVLFLHRPDQQNRQLIELTIAKQRNGPTGSTFLHGDMERMRFLPTDERPAVKQTRARGFNTFADRTSA